MRNLKQHTPRVPSEKSRTSRTLESHVRALSKFTGLKRPTTLFAWAREKHATSKNTRLRKTTCPHTPSRNTRFTHPRKNHAPSKLTRTSHPFKNTRFMHPRKIKPLTCPRKNTRFMCLRKTRALRAFGKSCASRALLKITRKWTRERKSSKIFRSKY